MADREKVIKGFECCHVMVHDLGPDKTSCGICPYMDAQTEEQIDFGGIECIAALHDDALAMLKEQEPMKPTWSQGKAYCGKCGQRLPRKRADKEINYCGYCGQAVKWG